MKRKSYVEVCFSDSDRSGPDSYHYLTIVVGKNRFKQEDGHYTTKESALALAKVIASEFGIEVRLEKD